MQTGSCLCGAVRLEVSGEPTRSGICHCLDCRKNHGAAFRAFAIYPRERLRVIGETRAYEHKGRRHFCPTCGSPLFSEDSPTEVEVFAGAFDAPNQMRPTYELWTIRREDWLPPLGVDAFPGDRP